MAKKYQFKLDPTIISTSDRNPRLVSGWQVESWLTGKANDQDINTPEGKAAFGLVLKLKEEFAALVKVEFAELAKLTSEEGA